MPVTRVKFRAGGGKEPRENQLWFKLGRIINFFYRVKLARVPPESKLSWGPPSHFSLNLYTPPSILNFGSPAGAILPRGLRYLAPGTLEDRLIISVYRPPPGNWPKGIYTKDKPGTYRPYSSWGPLAGAANLILSLA